MTIGTNDQGPFWNPEVLENRVFMLLPLVFNDKSMLDVKASSSLNDFVKQMKSIPPTSFTNSAGAYFPNMGSPKSPRLWTDIPGDATQDFHPFVRQIASVSRNATPDERPFSRPLQIADEFLISQLNGGKPRQFHLALGKSATKRSGKNSLALQFHAPSMYTFASGTAILVLEWSYLKQSDSLPVRAQDVLEGNYLLSHPTRGNTKDLDPDGNNIRLDPQSLMKIAVSLIPTELALQIKSDRRFIYTAIRIPSDVPQKHELEVALFCRRLARRENGDYQPNPAEIVEGQISPFSNVRHVAAIEGGCTLVEAGPDSPEFLRSLLKDRVRNTYLPLALVSIHSYFWLLNMTQTLPDSAKTPNAHSEKENLRSLQERLLNFRRTFHFLIASQITQHNEFHNLWQSQLQINRQLISLTELSASAASMVQEKRVKLIGYLSGGAGGFLLGKEILEAISNKVSMNTYEWQNKLLEAILTPDLTITKKIQDAIHTAETMEWVVFLGSVLCGVIGIWIASRFDLHGKHD